MRKILLTAALLTAAAATPAFAAPAHQFSADGETYTYAAQPSTDGSVLLTGTVEGTGDAFKLRVAGRTVEGTMGVSPVSFRVSQATADRFRSEIAAQEASGTALASN